MRVLRGRDALEPDLRGAAITIGTFDGVHRGHRALIGKTKEVASVLDAAACVVTWDRHPAETLRPDRVPPLLTTLERKIELIAESGVDTCAVLEFDETLSHWPPQQFASMLAERLGARAVLVGADWRFGHRAAGDVALLERLGAEIGFSVTGMALEEIGEDAVSSSRVRAAITGGDVAAARDLLGRPFDWDGTVVHGDDRGAGLGFPTANVAIDEALAHPPRGVYAGRAGLVAGTERRWFAAAINLGINPTFGGEGPPRIEAYLLDFAGDLYGQELRIEFWERLRDEMKFESVSDLVDQIGKDVEATRGIVDSASASDLLR